MQSQHFPQIRIGTRGSPLALWQAYDVQRQLGEVHGIPEEARDEIMPIVVIKTTGDRIQDRPLNAIGGKGLFTKEIEEALLESRVDIAVHCVKDMPTVCPPGLTLALTMEREDPRDAFISPKAARLEDLPEGAVIGSTSLRRQAQILNKRPDLSLVTYRGVVETRLRKLEEGEVDATLLAVSGLKRLGKEEVITEVMDTGLMIPAVGQGALTIEVREGDEVIHQALMPLRHEETEVAISAERAFLTVLDGSCRTPIAGWARFEGDNLRFDGRILMPDGSEAHDISREVPRPSMDEAQALGTKWGEDLKEQAGEDFMARLKAAVDAAAVDPAANPSAAPTS